MSRTVDVRTRGWNCPDCTFERWVDDSYEDDDGRRQFDQKWESSLKCDCIAIDPKHDYCRTCGLTLEYP